MSLPALNISSLPGALLNTVQLFLPPSDQEIPLIQDTKASTVQSQCFLPALLFLSISRPLGSMISLSLLNHFLYLAPEAHNCLVYLLHHWLFPLRFLAEFSFFSQITNFGMCQASGLEFLLFSIYIHSPSPSHYYKKRLNVGESQI